MKPLGLLLHRENEGVPLSVFFVAPKGREAYFNSVDRFMHTTLGERAIRFYQVIIGEPDTVAQEVRRGIETVVRYRHETAESFAYN